MRLKLLYFWRRLKMIGARSTWGYCLRCGRAWGGTGSPARPHQTWFGKKLPGSKGTYGVFPLCEECWHALTPAARLPFYRRLFRKWSGSGPQWETIEHAVLNEKEGEE